MAEAKKSSFFISRNPLDFLNKSRVELPKVNVSKHETGREVMVVDVKPARNCSKIDTLLNSPRKRLVTTKGISLENKSPAPSPCKRSNLKKDFCSPRTTRLAARKILGESNTATSTPLFSAATGHYEFKMKDNDALEETRIIEHRPTDSDENHSKTVGKKVANFELNLNLALNVDRHKKHKPESELLSVTEKNTTMDTNQPSAIKVAVRMRPLADNEKSDKTILIKDNKVLVLPKNECFEFDYCLNSSNPELFDFASQEMVYRKMGEPLLKNAFQGYNVCLFAYGQSGSGKTYTMMGNETVPGIIPRFLNDLYKQIHISKDIEFSVNISFMEIYNEKIYDLLSDEFGMYGKNLRVREHPQTGPYVEDITVYAVDNYENALELLENGQSRRSTHSTSSNEQSSRSHSIFSILLIQNKTVESSDSSSEISSSSKINLVDLAGSERANTSSTDRFREGTMINKSLLTLGKVISQLAETNGGHGQHIPYRDSILTYLLKDSLGGNSRTSMIATISPAKIHLEETVRTLRYASTAQKIINFVHVNEDPKVKMINTLLKQISFLKKEVDKSKDHLECSKSSEALNKSNISKRSDYSEAFTGEITQLKDKFESLIERKNQIAKNLSKLKEESKKVSSEKLPKYEFQSKIVSELKTMLKDVEKVDILDGVTDVTKELKQIETEFNAIVNDYSSHQKESNKKEEKKETTWSKTFVKETVEELEKETPGKNKPCEKETAEKETTAGWKKISTKEPEKEAEKEEKETPTTSASSKKESVKETAKETGEEAEKVPEPTTPDPWSSKGGKKGKKQKMKVDLSKLQDEEAKKAEDEEEVKSPKTSKIEEPKESAEKETDEKGDEEKKEESPEAAAAAEEESPVKEVEPEFEFKKGKKSKKQEKAEKAAAKKAEKAEKAAAAAAEKSKDATVSDDEYMEANDYTADDSLVSKKDSKKDTKDEEEEDSKPGKKGKKGKKGRRYR